MLGKAVVEMFAVNETIGGKLILTATDVAAGVHGRLRGESVGSADEFLDRVLAVLGTLRGAEMVKQLASPSELPNASASIAAANALTAFGWCGPPLSAARAPPPTAAATTLLPSGQPRKRVRAPHKEEAAGSSAPGASPGGPLTAVFKQTKKAKVAKPKLFPIPGPSGLKKPLAPQLAAQLAARQTPVDAAGRSDGGGGRDATRADDTVSAPRRCEPATSPLALAPMRKAEAAVGLSASAAAPHASAGAARRALDQAFEAEQGREDGLLCVAAPLDEPLPLSGMRRAAASSSLQPTPSLSAPAAPTGAEPHCPGTHAWWGALDGLGSQHSRTEDGALDCVRDLLQLSELSSDACDDDDDFGAFGKLLDACAITGEQLACALMRDDDASSHCAEGGAPPALPQEERGGEPRGLGESSCAQLVPHAPLGPRGCGGELPWAVRAAPPLSAAGLGLGAARAGCGSEPSIAGHVPTREPLAALLQPTSTGGGAAKSASPPRPADADPASTKRRADDGGNVMGGLRRYAGSANARGSTSRPPPHGGAAAAASAMLVTLPHAGFRFAPTGARSRDSLPHGSA